VGGIAMSGFSPSWLALREPADLAARNSDVRAAMRLHFATRDTITVCDLGAGTGASLRAVAESLPPAQKWILVDHDSRNLAAAMDALTAWADKAERQPNGITLRRDGKMIDVQVRVHDFAKDPACWPRDTDLVTASALFDLASTAWIGDFVAALSRDRITLLSMLTADENIRCSPPHSLDHDIIAAFHRHQTRDKGFGPSAGPQAARIMEDALTRAGYQVTAGDSPWVLSPSPLLDATTQGMAEAIGETGDVGKNAVAEWLKHQHEQVQRLHVGHRDVFAHPL